MSRRCFLAAASASLAVPFAKASERTEPAPGEPGEYLNPQSFRPAPNVRIYSAVVRLKPPYWLGWPGTSYDLEQHRAHYNQTFSEAAARLGVDLSIEPTPLESDEEVGQFIEKLKAEHPDGVLVSLQHFDAWRWADAISQAGLPTIIFAPIGTAFTGHVRDISRRPGVHVISSLETSAVEQAMRMVRAKRQFEESRLLVVAGNERNETILERLGTKVLYVPRSVLPDRFEQTPETEEAHTVAGLMRDRAQDVIEPTRQDLLNAARTYIAAKSLLKQESANAITTDCLGMVTERLTPTPPCMAATLFQDAGLTYGCEADVFGAISLMFTSYLFDKPGFMNDPVPETVKNVLIAAHCVSGRHIRGFKEPVEPYILRSHSESGLGVALQVIWPVGEAVTLVRFEGPHKVIVDTGTVAGNVQTPPAGGCRTSVEIAMDRVEDVREVLGFHQVVFHGNHRRDIQNFCQMYGIEVVHSPSERTA